MRGWNKNHDLLQLKQRGVHLMESLQGERFGGFGFQRGRFLHHLNIE